MSSDSTSAWLAHQSYSAFPELLPLTDPVLAEKFRESISKIRTVTEQTKSKLTDRRAACVQAMNKIRPSMTLPAITNKDEYPKAFINARHRMRCYEQMCTKIDVLTIQVTAVHERMAMSQRWYAERGGLWNGLKNDRGWQIVSDMVSEDGDELDEEDTDDELAGLSLGDSALMFEAVIRHQEIAADLQEAGQLLMGINWDELKV